MAAEDKKIQIRVLVLGNMQTNCYLVFHKDTKQAVIIDPAAKAERIKKACGELEVKPVAILLTHGHFDHIGAAKEIKEHFDIPVYASEMEREVLNNAYYNLSEIMGEDRLSIDADNYISDEQKFSLAGFEIRAISTPGHTAGGMCYLFSCGEEQALFSGDTIFAGSVGRYDFPTSSGTALFQSIRQKLFILPKDLEVYPGHGLSTTIGKEEPRFR